MSAGAERTRPLEAVINLSDIRHNVSFLKGLLDPGCRFMGVVKANAYGHGDVEVSRAALSAGADCLGVALVEEAARLRGRNIDCPIHLLFEPPPYAAAAVIGHDLVCAVYSPELARALSEEAVARGMRARVHIKVDTGMRRVGVHPSAVPGFAAFLRGLEGLDVEGIYTHFATATEPEDPFTERQMDLFDESAVAARTVLGRRLEKHAANSAAVMAFPRSHYDMVRVGIAMYGLVPSPDVPRVEELRPALSLTGKVVFVKRVAAGEGISYGLIYAPEEDSFIATLPLGYADGLSRVLTGNLEVIIEGRRRPVVGAICMDLCMADLGREPVRPGSRLVVIGRDGDEAITAEEIAGRMGTINYEVVCMISSRVPRVYVEE